MLALAYSPAPAPDERQSVVCRGRARAELSVFIPAAGADSSSIRSLRNPFRSKSRLRHRSRPSRTLGYGMFPPTEPCQRSREASSGLSLEVGNKIKSVPKDSPVREIYQAFTKYSSNRENISIYWVCRCGAPRELFSARLYRCVFWLRNIRSSTLVRLSRAK
jgi:hypothetical protein